VSRIRYPVLVAAALIVSCLVGALAIRFAVPGRDDRDCPAGSSSLCPETVTQQPAADFRATDALVDDPTSSGRITTRMLHTHDEVNRVFHDWRWGIGCWDSHQWNPTSDHPRGRACDFTVGRLGRLPTDKQRTTGWQLARWAQLNADALGIRYIIWDGQIWSSSRFRHGWRPYNGGGVYDPASPTGGHFDHVHLSTIGNA